LAYTSNLVSSGLRETIRFLVQHKLVDVLVTTAGGVEEDVIKCLGPTRIGDFSMSGKDLRKRGLNRIGNLLVPNDNYCKFEVSSALVWHACLCAMAPAAVQGGAWGSSLHTPRLNAWRTPTPQDWVTPILHAMADEQESQGARWTPSKVIDRLGKEIGHPDSIYYWAHRHGIPVFCPAITDGSLGDMMYFFSYKRPEFAVDVVADIRRINDIAVRARATGMIILGGGLVKHHTCNANLMRNGADFSVYVNTGQEFDGSDCGARPDEAVSWGKIKVDASPVKVYADASIVFPLLVSQTFAKDVFPDEA
jgi:deoxyhypusine synthase